MSDRAAVVTTAIMQIIATAPEGELRQAIESYLREEFDDAAKYLPPRFAQRSRSKQRIPAKQDPRQTVSGTMIRSKRAAMSNDVVKKEPNTIDSFTGWSDDIEGSDRPEGAGIIQGNVDKFANEGDWETRDGEKIAGCCRSSSGGAKMVRSAAGRN